METFGFLLIGKYLYYDGIWIAFILMGSLMDEINENPHVRKILQNRYAQLCMLLAIFCLFKRPMCQKTFLIQAVRIWGSTWCTWCLTMWCACCCTDIRKAWMECGWQSCISCRWRYVLLPDILWMSFWIRAVRRFPQRCFKHWKWNKMRKRWVCGAYLFFCAAGAGRGTGWRKNK